MPLHVVDLDGKLRTTDRYDLLGNLLSRRESYTQNGQTDIVDRTYTYDSRSRMTKETAQLNGQKGELAVVNYSYNDLGQLIGKTYGTGSYAIHEKIAYNLQGWTTSKSSEMFDLYLSYDAPSQKMAAPSYTGNISESLWRHKCLNGNPDSQTADYRYDYTYDDLSRLKSAESYYNSRNNLLEKYCERISYDKNGNIVTLNRPGTTSAESQNYIFTYSGNQRTGETNSGSAYAYDANGNMHCDALTGFYIHHNFLNLPDAICTESNSGVHYRYLADGTKVEMRGYDDNRPYYYVGSLIYQGQEASSPSRFESTSFGAGRIVGTHSGSEVHYFLTDQLGSTRVVAKVSSAARRDLDRKDYYAYGKAWKNPDMPTSYNRYTFSGKELQHAPGGSIGYMDFGARFYDPDTGIFLQQDPMAEKLYPIASYNYCKGNPINLIDPTGMETKDEEEQRKREDEEAEREAKEWKEQGDRDWRAAMSGLENSGFFSNLSNANIVTTQRSEASNNAKATAELIEKMQSMTLEEWVLYVEKMASNASFLSNAGTIVMNTDGLNQGMVLLKLGKVFNVIGYGATSVQMITAGIKICTGQRLENKDKVDLALNVAGISSTMASNYANAAIVGLAIGGAELALISLTVDGLYSYGSVFIDVILKTETMTDQYLRNVMPQRMFNPAH